MAYALQSLIHILEHILLPQNHHQNLILDDQKPVLESLLENVKSLKDDLERCPPTLSMELEGVGSKIRDASHKAEDIVESLTAGVTSTFSQCLLPEVKILKDTVQGSPPNLSSGYVGGRESEIGGASSRAQGIMESRPVPANRLIPKQLKEVIHEIVDILLPKQTPDARLLIQSLVEKARSLKDLLERCPPNPRKELEDLQRKIMNASHKAREIIVESQDETSRISSQELQTVLDEFDYAEKALAKMTDGNPTQEEDPIYRTNSFRTLLCCCEWLMSCYDTICQWLKEPGEVSDNPRPSEIVGRSENMARTLQSLIHAIEDILQLQTDSFQNRVKSVKDILGSCAPNLSQVLEVLESKTRDASHKAEDIIESCTPAVISKISSQELQKVILEFDSAKKMMDIGRSRIRVVERNASILIPSRPDLSHKDFVVGLDADLFQLKDRLTRNQYKLNVIPIVGMGGLGKTTLAANVYDDPLVVSRFDTRAWVTVSQGYDCKVVLLSLLRCLIGELTEEILQSNTNELKLTSHQYLFYRRYLIILDDVWGTEVWDDIKWCLPEKNNDSRIILTTRALEVADYANRSKEHHQMHELNQLKSWELLQKTVFGHKECPPSLEELGRMIASNCKGLPLAITVIGGLLSTATHDQNFWKEVAHNINSIVSSNDQFSDIFALSYDHLPSYLKPCLLYFGAFPEYSNVGSSRLIRLWIAEGFLKPVEGKSLEEAAEHYLKSLVDRNLISVHKRETNQRAKSYRIHDLVSDLCLKKAIQEKFFHVQNGKAHDPAKDTINLRRVSVHPSYGIREIYAAEKLMLLSRSFVCTGLMSREILSPIFLALKMLRILDVLEIEFHKFPEEIFQLSNLRYLALACRSELPSDIETLTNLQTLIVWRRSHFYTTLVPSELWKMLQLRHVKFKGTYVWCTGSDVHGHVLGENLQTLSYVRATNAFLKCFPNLRKLGIVCVTSNDIVTDLSRQEKLETLKCITDGLPYSKSNSFSELDLPPSLKKLCLVKCPISPRLMSRIGSLPNLDVLKLKDCIFQDMPASGEAEWEVAEGEFSREVAEGKFSKLQLLELKKLNLVHWTVKDSLERPFSTLKRLVIRECTALKSIPDGIGDIDTLEMIELHNASPGTVASANKILEEQREGGNDVLQVREYGASSKKNSGNVAAMHDVCFLD